MGLLECITSEAAFEAISAISGLDPSKFKIVNAKCDGQASKVGEGYVSDVKRIFITYEVLETKEEKTEAMVCKFRVSKSSPKQHWWESMQLFERETEFYSKLLPKLQAMANDNPLPLPNVYYAQPGASCILMEDLKLAGYKLAHDIDPAWKAALPPTFVHAIMKELARFHAISYHFLNTYAGGSEAFAKDFPLINEAAKLGQFVTRDEAIRRESFEMYHKLLKEMLPVVKEIVDDPGLASRFEQSFGYLHDNCGDCRDPNGHSFCLVIHGDVWSNNILTKLDAQGNVASLCFIDFQESMKSRPSTDISCFIANSISADVRQKHLPQFLDTYHQALVDNLKPLGYDGAKLMSRTDLDESIRTGYGQGFYWGIMNAWGSLASDSLFDVINENPDADNMDSRKVKVDKNNLHPSLKQLKCLLEEADDFGLFQKPT